MQRTAKPPRALSAADARLCLIETQMKIKLSSIVNGMEFQDLESGSYLNSITGEVILVADEEIRDVKSPFSLTSPLTEGVLITLTYGMRMI